MSGGYFRGWRPLGLGTDQVESLTSAVRRLACSDVRVVGYVLSRYVIDPYRRSHGDRHPLFQPTRATESVNGANATASVIVEQLSSEGVIDLHRGTLLGRDDAIEFREGFRTWRAWCPACLEEDGEDPYDRLAWAFISSRSCRQHQLLLVDECGRCRRRHRPWHAGANPWSCPLCGEPLVSARRTACPRDAEGAAVVELLRILEGGSSIDRGRVATAFDGLRVRVGGLRNLATRLDQSASGLSTVCAGRTRPHLALVLRALALADEPMSSFLASKPVRQRPPPSRTRRRGWPRRQASPIRRALRALLRSPASPPSLRQFGRANHIDPATVRQRYPALAAELVARRRVFESARRASAEQRLAETVRAVFAQLAGRGLPPSRREIEAALGKPGLLRAPAVRRAYLGSLGNPLSG